MAPGHEVTRVPRPGASLDPPVSPTACPTVLPHRPALDVWPDPRAQPHTRPTLPRALTPMGPATRLSQQKRDGSHGLV